MFRINKKENGKVNVNSSHTMSWKDKTKQNSRQSQMRESLYKTKHSLGSKSMYLAVILPEKPAYYVEDPEYDKDEISEWLAENCVDFHNEVQLLYGVLAEGNEEWNTICQSSETKTGIGYPRNVKYMWKSSRDAQPKELPVDVYVDHVVLWINAQIENEDVFPTDEEVPFPQNFRKHLKKIFQRMFRIFAIIYSNESLYNRKDIESHLGPCFRHFIYFSLKWQLVDKKEMKCVDKIAGPIITKFYRDEKLYLEQKLPLDENVDEDK
eukprot:maker-scaffold_29-snap-gene-0.52-mRNA-1 protein AED:0.00 eAED:0.00 QI:145/1/1/1/1/1/2/431/265